MGVNTFAESDSNEHATNVRPSMSDPSEDADTATGSDGIEIQRQATFERDDRPEV
jgi:hypothetical protein